MLIWGWRSRAKTIGEGEFLCPHCGVDRRYAHKELRRWFTLFFIPLIPLKVLGEFVECAACKQRFNTTVLQGPTNARVQENILLAVREALATLLVDPTPAQREAAVTVLSSFSDQPCTDAELRDLLAAVDLSDLQPRLATIAPVLNEQGKEHLLAACTRVVATGGVIDGQTRAKIEEIGSGLLMTPAHVRGVIDQVLEAARA